MAWSTHADAETAVNALEAHFCRLLAVSTPTITGGATTAATTGTGMVVNTTTETSLVDFTVPAASVAVGDVLQFEAALDVRNNSGGTINYTLKTKLGATTLIFTGPFAYTNNNDRFEAYVRSTLILAATSDQRWKGEIMGGTAGASTGGFMSLAFMYGGAGASTENLSTDKTLSLTVTMASANANADCRLLGASLTRLR